jgi:hypothetical protein
MSFSFVFELRPNSYDFYRDLFVIYNKSYDLNLPNFIDIEIKLQNIN